MSAIPPQRLSYRHRAIARWMLVNPDRTLGECAEALGYTQAWLSVVTNSEGFRELMARLQREGDDEVIQTIPDRMREVADLSLEKLEEAVRDSDMGNRSDREFIRETADTVLHRLGYAPARGPAPSSVPAPIVNNVIFVERELVHEVRATLLARGELPAPAEGEKVLGEMERIANE